MNDYQTKVSLIKKMKLLLRHSDQQNSSICQKCSGSLGIKKANKGMQTELQLNEIKRNIKNMKIHRDTVRIRPSSIWSRVSKRPLTPRMSAEDDARKYSGMSAT